MGIGGALTSTLALLERPRFGRRSQAEADTERVSAGVGVIDGVEGGSCGGSDDCYETRGRNGISFESGIERRMC